jgi:hypothetical protein
MKHSNDIMLFIMLLLSVSILNGCDEISHGQQRRKFEFLYKTNNFAAVFREYTNDIVKFSDLQLYETRMNKLYEDVNKFETVKGWTKSDAIKEDFLNSIDKSLNAVRSMKMKQSLYREFIKDEHEVILMRETAEDFLENVENEITVVGRE